MFNGDMYGGLVGGRTFIARMSEFSWAVVSGPPSSCCPQVIQLLRIEATISSARAEHVPSGM